MQAATPPTVTRHKNYEYEKPIDSFGLLVKYSHKLEMNSCLSS